MLPMIVTGIGSTVPKAGFALDVAGIILATSYRGDGSQLTGVSGSGGITGINTLATSALIILMLLEFLHLVVVLQVSLQFQVMAQ